MLGWLRTIDAQVPEKFGFGRRFEFLNDVGTFLSCDFGHLGNERKVRSIRQRLSTLYSLFRFEKEYQILRGEKILMSRVSAEGENGVHGREH